MITFSHYRGLHWRHRGHQRSDTGRKHSHASNALITVCVVARTINGSDNCAHDTARGFWRPVTSLIIVFLPGIRLCTAKSHARTVRPDGRSRLFCFDRYRKSGWKYLEIFNFCLYIFRIPSILTNTLLYEEIFVVWIYVEIYWRDIFVESECKDCIAYCSLKLEMWRIFIIVKLN